MSGFKLNRKSKIIFSGLIVILILALLIVINPWKNFPGGTKTPAKTGSAPTNQGTAQIAAPTSTDSATFRDPVPANTVVPETNTILTGEQAKVIAVPTVVVPAATQGSAHYRSFDIKGEGGLFIPSQITAYVGDRVHINLTAVDKDYDIVFPSYNMMIAAKKGETKALEFKAMFEGSFDYYCNACGGPNGPTKGKIIIVK
jgi:plastocyanin